MKELLPKLIPNVFYWIELGRIGWQFQQINVGWRLEAVTAMPTGTINHHDNVLVGVTRRDLIEEELHALGIDVRQDQTVELAGTYIYRCIGIGVFVCEHGSTDGA